MRSASRSASSRYWVVRSTVVPDARSSCDRVPDVAAAARVQPGRRLVEEHHRRVGDEAHREVEPALRAAAEGGHAPVAHVGEVEALEQLGGAAAGLRRGRAAAAGPSSAGSPRRSAGASTAAYWPVRLMLRRTARGCVATSWPATIAVPASARSSVERIRTVVVLPAPFGPSSANTEPASTRRSSPVRTGTSPNDFRSPVACRVYVIHHVYYIHTKPASSLGRRRA